MLHERAIYVNHVNGLYENIKKTLKFRSIRKLRCYGVHVRTIDVHITFHVSSLTVNKFGVCSLSWWSILTQEIYEFIFTSDVHVHFFIKRDRNVIDSYNFNSTTASKLLSCTRIQRTVLHYVVKIWFMIWDDAMFPFFSGLISPKLNSIGFRGLPSEFFTSKKKVHHPYSWVDFTNYVFSHYRLVIVSKPYEKNGSTIQWK